MPLHRLRNSTSYRINVNLPTVRTLIFNSFPCSYLAVHHHGQLCAPSSFGHLTGLGAFYLQAETASLASRSSESSSHRQRVGLSKEIRMADIREVGARLRYMHMFILEIVRIMMSARRHLDSDIIYFHLFGTPVVVLNSAVATYDLLEKRSAIYSQRWVDVGCSMNFLVTD